jgi:Peptidase family M23
VADTAQTRRDRAARAKAKAAGGFLITRPGRADVNLLGQVIDAVREEPLDAAPTLTVTLDDPNWTLTNSTIFDMSDDGRLDIIETWYENVAWRLVKVSPNNDTLTLVFEDRSATVLREFVEAGKFQRKRTRNYTRAMFIRDVIKRVNAKSSNKVEFKCPRLSQKQAVAKGQTPRKSDDLTGVRGISKREARSLTVKGGKMNSVQRKNANLVLAVAEAEDAPHNAKLALIEACIVESQITNLPDGDGTSVGILQVTSGKKFKRNDVERCAQEFLVNGFTGRGGAITLANTTTMSPGQIAQACQGSAYPDRYEQFRAEANAIVKAFDGGDLAEPNPQRTRYTDNAYWFALGQVGQPESAWDCITRLAEEVNWRLFVKDGLVFYMPDDDLYRQEPKRSLSRSTLFFITETKNTIVKNGNMIVTDMSFDWDQGKPVYEMEITLADRVKLRHSESIETTGFGPASTRWLVWETTKSLADDTTTLVLRSPQRAKKEPTGGTTSHTIGDPTKANGAVDLKTGYADVIIDKHHLLGLPGEGTHSFTEPPNNWESDNACDYAVPVGTPVFAAFAGRIGPSFGALGGPGSVHGERAGSRFAGLRLHLVSATNELYYAHLSKFRPGLSPGDKVKAGELLGYSGVANGVAHLHLGEKRSNRPYIKWFNKGGVIIRPNPNPGRGD